jgi:hypothetical protein
MILIRNLFLYSLMASLSENFGPVSCNLREFKGGEEAFGLLCMSDHLLLYHCGLFGNCLLVYLVIERSLERYSGHP